MGGMGVEVAVGTFFDGLVLTGPVLCGPDEVQLARTMRKARRNHMDGCFDISSCSFTSQTEPLASHGSSVFLSVPPPYKQSGLTTRGCTKRPGERAEEAKSEAGNMI
jgi:hypothetical protein